MEAEIVVTGIVEAGFLKLELVSVTEIVDPAVMLVDKLVIFRES